MNTNKDIINSFLTDSINFSKVTLNNYGLELKRFFRFINKPYNQITPKDIKTWLSSLYDVGYKSGTILTKFMRIRSFYKYCIEENLISKDPFEILEIPIVEDKLPYYLNREQMDKLRELVKDNKRGSAIVETIYSTGIRVGELVDIKISDIDWDNKIIKIMGKGKKERFVLFTNKCEIRLKEYLENRKDTNPYLFINKIGGRKMITKGVQRLFENCNKKLGFHLSAHTLRHTFAASLAENGMQINYIQRLLGHKSMYATKIYMRLCKRAQKMAYDKFY